MLIAEDERHPSLSAVAGKERREGKFPRRRPTELAGEKVGPQPPLAHAAGVDFGSRSLSPPREDLRLRRGGGQIATTGAPPRRSVLDNGKRRQAHPLSYS